MECYHVAASGGLTYAPSAKCIKARCFIYKVSSARACPALFLAMPPKRDAAQLCALAENPVGWVLTPVAKRTEIGIVGDYLSAFLKHESSTYYRSSGGQWVCTQSGAVSR